MTSSLTSATSTPAGGSVDPRAERTHRRRVAFLALVILVTSLAALPGSYLYPAVASGGDGYAYTDLAPIRELWWGLNVFLAAGLVLCVPGLALAGLLLTPRRGAGWASAGAALMWIGTAFYAVGVGGLATLYYFATDPALLDPAVAAGFLERVGSGFRLYAVALPGAVLVALGTVLQAVGLWRSRNVPRWVPLMSLGILVTFFLDNSGVLGAVLELPITISAIAVGYYAWRRA